jgi:hypothetical protein
MDLIQYLSQRKDKKGKLTSKKTKGVGKKKLDRIPRRGRGFGQRHRAYREYKNSNKASETDTKILALLTTLVKQNQPTIDLSKPETLNPFIEREKQTYSMKFEPKIKTLEERLEQVEQKQLPMGEQTQPEETQAITMGDEGDISSFIQGVESSFEDKEQKQIELATITNKLADYETKWTDIVEIQEELKQEIDDIPVGDMRDLAQENFRLQNLEVKENVFSLQQELQEELNQAIDLNDYREFIDFQKKVLGVSVNNFVEVDNRLAGELIQGKRKLREEVEGFTQLQDETFKEKELLQEGYDLLNIELVKSQSTEKGLMEELDSITKEMFRIKKELDEKERNPASSPPRVDVEEIELPKPKPTEEELQAKKEKKEALRIGRVELERQKKQEEAKNVRLTQQLVEWSKTSKSYAGKIQDKVIDLFGSEENEKIKALGGSLAPKQKRIKQLLKEKRGIEF